MRFSTCLIFVIFIPLSLSGIGLITLRQKYKLVILIFGEDRHHCISYTHAQHKLKFPYAYAEYKLRSYAFAQCTSEFLSHMLSACISN